MYCRPTFSAPVEVDFLMGGNMSFRREVARRLEFDMAAQPQRRPGLRGRHRPAGARRWDGRSSSIRRWPIRHYSAPRATVGLRPDADTEGVKWYAFNHVRVALASASAALALDLVGVPAHDRRAARSGRAATGTVPAGTPVWIRDERRARRARRALAGDPERARSGTLTTCVQPERRKTAVGAPSELSSTSFRQRRIRRARHLTYTL